MGFLNLKLQILSEEFKYVLLHKAISAQTLSILQLHMPCSLFMSHKEISLVVPVQANIKEAQKIEEGWKCIQVIGNMPFGTVQGLIASITTTLKSSNLGTCVVSTFQTDWFFIRSKNLEQAVSSLKSAGWVFIE